MSEKTQELPLIVNIKKEKVTPERETIKEPTKNVEEELDKILESNLFGGNEDNDEKKNIEPTKTSDELLEELFGAIGASGVNIPDILDEVKKEKKSKKKKRKHDDDSDSESKPKKSKKSKKIKKESDEDIKPKIKKIKKEKKDKDKEKEKSEKKKDKSKDDENHKLSIVIKDFRTTTSTSKSSKHDEKKRDDKSKKRKDRKNDESDVSLSDEETYQKMFEYHTSSKWIDRRRTRSRSRSRSRERNYDWNRDRRRRSRDDDRHSNRYRRHSHSRSRSEKREPIDKKKLLEIARKNAISMLKNGALPKNISETTKEKLMAKIRHGGKSIEELTNYCKKLSKAEDLGELSELSDSDNDAEGRAKVFHPFEVRDRGPIVMNIRNSIPIPPKPASELKALMSQFPVSSGRHHSKIENTWIPVTTTSHQMTASTSTTTITSSSNSTASKQIVTLEKQIQEQLPELAKPKVIEHKPLNPVLTKPYNWKSDDHYMPSAIIPELAPPPAPPIEVSDIISQRLNAMKKLQENPNDFQASKTLQETQQNMSQWAASKYTPGQFLGSTEVQVLSHKELAGGYQAWARKNQLIETQPVNSGMGMHLLKKMGWTPGEGLGKEKNGSLEPLLLELKLDKRGLEANEESKQNRNGLNRKQNVKKNPMAGLDQKHPVSLLGELSAKRKWGAPAYDLVHESGPAHAKHFIFKIRLNGIEYSCPEAANNKKEAKSLAAKFCLQQLGILPTT